MNSPKQPNGADDNGARRHAWAKKIATMAKWSEDAAGRAEAAHKHADEAQKLAERLRKRKGR
jgi:hypothetical protein